MLGEDTEYDETNVEGWEMEDDDVTLPQSRRTRKLLLNIWILGF